MTKQEFIRLLIENNFCTSYEAEEYVIYCGEDGWAYSHPFTKDRAIQLENSIQFYPSNNKKVA